MKESTVDDETSLEPVLYESHSHTPLCNHAVGQPTEYAAVAEQRGLRGLIVTCHNPMPSGFSKTVRMREDELQDYIDLVEQTRQQWAGRVDVRLGLEADYFQGMEDYLKRQLDSANFHFVLGSVHPQLSEFRDRYWVEDPLQVQRTYFQLLAEAAESGLFDSLAHPDLIKNLMIGSWNETAILPHICVALDRIAATGIAMELNTSGVNKSLPEMNPFPDMLVEIHRRGIPMTIGADAHEPGRVADGYETALELLQASGFRHVSYFLGRERQEVAIDTALASLRRVDAVSG
ncbi:MAG: histidinol-phosphatase HisJ family protein [Planctomycetota bacterium]